MYNIDEEDLTHMGQSLSTFDDFKDDYDSDDDDRGEIDEQIVDEYHFGGLMRKKEDGQEGRPKTKKEVMEEIIAKSKFYKVPCAMMSYVGHETNTCNRLKKRVPVKSAVN